MKNTAPKKAPKIAPVMGLFDFLIFLWYPHATRYKHSEAERAREGPAHEVVRGDPFAVRPLAVQAMFYASLEG